MFFIKNHVNLGSCEIQMCLNFVEKIQKETGYMYETLMTSKTVSIAKKKAANNPKTKQKVKKKKRWSLLRQAEPEEGEQCVHSKLLEGSHVSSQDLPL